MGRLALTQGKPGLRVDQRALDTVRLAQSVIRRGGHSPARDPFCSEAANPARRMGTLPCKDAADDGLKRTEWARQELTSEGVHRLLLEHNAPLMGYSVFR